MIKRDCAILIVDNDPAAGALLAQQISDIPGMSVSACLTDGNQAIDYLLAHPVDILMTEIDLPGTSGLELITFCRKYNLGYTTIIVSSVRDFDIAIQALHCGALDYLPKPLNFTQLAEVLETARSKVHLSRLYLRARLNNPYQTLERSICASFRNGASPELWLGQLNQLLTTPGQLLRISHQPPICETRSFAFAIYRKILSSLLPGAAKLCLSQDKNSALFLLIYPLDRPNRTVQSLEEWFAHIVEHKVTLTVEGTIESAEQLSAMIGKAQERRKTIETACAYIQSHLSQPLTRETVAKQVFLSPSYFGQLFKQTMGICFSDYVMQLRISHAKTILAQNIPIREVAAAVGFQTVTYFSRIFYKETGYTPSEYRRALLTGTIKQN